jgi:uncharacterized Zn finger protein
MSWEVWHYEAARPKPIKNGIKTKSQRGAIGETWWSKRWIQVLESLGMGARLGRGRSYARRGQVISVEIQKGVVQAKVQGSQARPYSITIGLKPLTDGDWDKVTAIMASQAIFAAKLLCGEMPQNIEEAFNGANVNLFPLSGQDLETDCSCPDYANPCKHIAAVYYILAENFDADPFLIFKLRGRSQEEIIQTLRQKRGQTLEVEKSQALPAEAIAESAAQPLEECLDNFWKAGAVLDTFTTDLAPPEIEGAILKRLGEPPAAAGGQNMRNLLLKAYLIAGKAALQSALTKPPSKKKD